MKLLFKNTIKKIRKSTGRFFSIMVIIALGVSFFIGLRESTPGILYTVDNYYDKHNLMDFKIISTKGLTSGDVEALKELKNAKIVIPSLSVDVLDRGSAIRVHSLEKEMNNLELVEGKEISNPDECIADYKKYSVGDTIEFSNDTEKMLKNKSCKVVGIAKSPLYITEDKGLSTVGNGKLSAFVYVLEEAFNKQEFFTEIYLIGKNTKEKHSYYDEYDKEIKPLKDELSVIKPIRETIRYEEILRKANSEISKSEKELNNELKNNLNKLNNAKKKLDEGKAKLNTEKNKLNSEKTKLNNELSKIENTLKTFGTSTNDIDGFITNLENQILYLSNQLTLLDEDSVEYQELLTNINILKTQVENLKKLKQGISEIKSGLSQIENGLDKISVEEKKINDGYKEYTKNYNKYLDEKDKAEKKIRDAKEEVKSLDKPEWYLLDRTENIGYTNFKDEVLRVDAISKFLPLFFVIVAMLMAVNTLSRLIEEERGELGILRSNGFSGFSIIYSYLIYISIAGIIGLLFGFTVGYSLIPRLIYNIFLSRYYVPKLITVVSPLPFTMVILITFILMIGVVLIALKRDLKEYPANLLRPKPPKKGKKILLERFRLWKKLNFTWKITIRNLFRFPKRVFMTVLGIGGCTALLLTGFGLNDSINKITKLQFNDIIKYDSMYILKESVNEISNDLLKVFKDNQVVNPLLIYQDTFKWKYEDKSSNSYLMVPKDTIAFNNYVNLNYDDKKLYINGGAALITKQMANFMNVSVGDTVEVRDKNNHLYFIKVGNIVENYVANYIYMSPEYYEEIFGKEIKYNTIIANGSIDSDLELSNYNVLTQNKTKDIIDTFDEFIQGLNMIIVLIIVLAAFLALSVLYNLTIINISERKREIATLKVLGFSDKEVSIFVYRETFLLTLLGILFGLFLGKYFHIFIISFAQMDNLRIINVIDLLSYGVSVFLTLLFSYMVQIFINKTLKKIDMIESLKSVE